MLISRGSVSSPSIRRKSTRAAVRPSSAASRATTVTPGSSRPASGRSSKPTRATVCCRPSRRNAPYRAEGEHVPGGERGGRWLGAAEQLDSGRLGGGGVGQVTDHGRAETGLVLHRPVQPGGERVADIGEQQADGPGPPVVAAQHAGLSITIRNVVVTYCRHSIRRDVYCKTTLSLDSS